MKENRIFKSSYFPPNFHVYDVYQNLGFYHWTSKGKKVGKILKFCFYYEYESKKLAELLKIYLVLTSFVNSNY